MNIFFKYYINMFGTLRIPITENLGYPIKEVIPKSFQPRQKLNNPSNK